MKCWFWHNWSQWGWPEKRWENPPRTPRGYTMVQVRRCVDCGYTQERRA